MAIVRHELEVVIPEDHRLLVEVPETMRTGPAKLILVASADDTRSEPTGETPGKREVAARWQAVHAEITRDGRPFRELSAAERRERLARLRGIGRGLFPSSDEIALSKRREVELEERKFAR